MALPASITSDHTTKLLQIDRTQKKRDNANPLQPTTLLKKLFVLKHSTTILIKNFQMSGIASLACPLCYSLSPTLKLHIRHLRLVHQADPNFKLTCAIKDCTKTFFTFPAFNRHVYRSHRRCLGLNSKYIVQDEGNSTCSPTVECHLTDDQAQQSIFDIIIEDHDTVANDQTNVTLSFDKDLKIEE